MSKEKMNLQQFADRHGLRVKEFAVQGPYGELYQNKDGAFCFRRSFNPVTHAKLAIEAIGLQYIVKKADGWYVEAGPFETRELARVAVESLKSNQQETLNKTT